MSRAQRALSDALQTRGTEALWLPLALATTPPEKVRAMAKKKRGTAKRGKSERGGSVRMLIVEARYYAEIADRLLAGAAGVLEEAGAEIDIVTVSGALEIPAAIAIACDAAKRQRRPYAGVVALGCVIRGETYHFEIVANESARGLSELALRERLPLGNGILTVDSEEQALVRLGGAEGHKGEEAARAALTLAALQQTLAER